MMIEITAKGAGRAEQKAGESSSKVSDRKPPDIYAIHYTQQTGNSYGNDINSNNNKYRVDIFFSRQCIEKKTIDYIHNKCHQIRKSSGSKKRNLNEKCSKKKRNGQA